MNLYNLVTFSKLSFATKGWVHLRVLGEGSCSTVFLTKSITGPLDCFAVKTTPILYSSSLSKEMHILTHFIGCPEIVQCLGSEITFDQKNPTKSFYNLKLEYASGGTLAHMIERKNKLPENEVKEYLRMILRGLSYVHGKGFVHADLKPANILAFPQSGGTIRLKIADFGHSMRCGEKEECFESPMFKGTPKYMSPESVSSSEFNCALDIWSLGCILVEMVSGDSVWENSDPTYLISKLVGDVEIPKIPEELSEEGKDFVLRCFDPNHKTRWTANMLLQHSYLRTV